MPCSSTSSSPSYDQRRMDDIFEENNRRYWEEQEEERRESLRESTQACSCNRSPMTAERIAYREAEFARINAPFASFVGLGPPGDPLPYGLMMGATLPRPGNTWVYPAPAHPPVSLQHAQPGVQYQPYMFPAQPGMPSVVVASAPAAARTCSASTIFASSACSIISVLGIAAYYFMA